MSEPPWAMNERDSSSSFGVRGSTKSQYCPIVPSGSSAERAELVPADDGLAGGGGDLRRPGDERQVVGVARRARLVASDVQVGAGRHRGQLAEHVLEERVGELGPRVERREPDLGARVRLRDLAIRVQLGHRRESRVGVAGEVDLGHDGDEPLGGVVDDLAVVGLRVEAALGPVDGVAATDLGQLGPRVDRDAPALVVGEVQVEVVELEQRQVVEVALDVVDGEEVAGHVEHGAAVGEARLVADGDGRHGAIGAGVSERHELAQALHGRVGARRRGCGDADAGRIDVERVALRGGDRRIVDEGDAANAFGGPASCRPVSDASSSTSRAAAGSRAGSATTGVSPVSTKPSAPEAVSETGSGTTLRRGSTVSGRHDPDRARRQRERRQRDADDRTEWAASSGGRDHRTSLTSPREGSQSTVLSACRLQNATPQRAPVSRTLGWSRLAFGWVTIGERRARSSGRTPGPRRISVCPPVSKERPCPNPPSTPPSPRSTPRSPRCSSRSSAASAHPRDDRERELRSARRARGAGLRAHQQVRRGLPRPPLLRRLRVRRRRRDPRHRARQEPVRRGVRERAAALRRIGQRRGARRDRHSPATASSASSSPTAATSPTA